MVKNNDPSHGYKRTISSTPQSLVTEGKINWGTFNKPFSIINPLDATGVFGFPVPRFIKYLRLKEWQAFQLGGPDCFMLVVLYNQKPAFLTQFIFYDKKEKQHLRYEKLIPSWQGSIPSTLFNTRAHYISKGFRMDFHNKISDGKIFIDIAIDSDKKQPGVYGHFEASHDLKTINPIVVSLPFDRNRGMYSHKCLMPMQGVLCLGDRKIDFSQQNSFAIVDDHKGYYPFVLIYDWVTGAGYNAKKELIGFNLTDNQVVDKERYNENCIWINNALHLLPPIKITRPKGVTQEWTIKDVYGMVDLVFMPVIDNIININLLFVKTDYHGPFGYFNGVIKTSSGTVVPIKNIFGMGEKKYLKG